MKFAENHSLKVPAYRQLMVWFGLVWFIVLGWDTAVSVQANDLPQQLDGMAQLVAQAEDTGSVRVLVQLNIPFRPEGELDDVQSVQAQQTGIQGLQSSVLDQLADTNTAVLATYKYIPYLALEMDAAALETLASLPQVVTIEEDIPVPPSLSSSIPVIGADQAWASGYTGSGQTVAILDTGVDTDHAAFTTGGSRIVSEGCYSTTSGSYNSITVCPGGVEESTAAGSGVDCTQAVGVNNSKAQSDCSHGTHVASIAAGDNGSNIVGVAPDANIIAIQVFSLFNNTTSCGGYSNCVLTYTSDQIAGLERVYELRNTYNIASVNMSLGGGQYYAACDSDSRKAAIDNLRAAGIATVIASGNDGFRDSMGAPGCISSAISVGATDDSDDVAYFSNVAPFIDLMAPGVSIYAAVPGGAGTKQGTSMATPHVTGAWAVLKQAMPGASVDEALAAFQSGATLVNDERSSGVATDLARINVNNAINSYATGLTVDVTASTIDLLPGDTVEMTLAVSNNNGAPASQIMLSASIPSALLLTSASLSGDAAVANNQITWTIGQTLNVGQSLNRTVSFTVRDGATPGAVLFTVTADSVDVNETRQDTAVLNIAEVVDCSFSDGFESGVLGAAWSTSVTEEGRVRVLSDLAHSGNYSAILDDSVAGAAKSEAGLILTADLRGQKEVSLDFSWHDLGDEYDETHDGVFVRESPEDSWVKVYDFAGSNNSAFQDAQIDLKGVAQDNNLTLTDRFQIKFSFYDNFSFNPTNIGSGDGYAIDDVSFSCTASGLTVNQQIDNQNPKPGDTVTFQITVVNNEAITATNSVISFIMAEGLQLNGEVVVDGGTADAPPLVASGIDLGPGQHVTITIPTVVSRHLTPGTILECVVTISSNEFGSLPPIKQSIVVEPTSGYQVFIPFVIR